MMMTAGSGYNVEYHHTPKYQNNKLLCHNSFFHSSNTACGDSDMSYNFTNDNLNLSSSLLQNDCKNIEEKIEHECDMNRCSPSEDEVRCFHPAARGQFGLDPFVLDGTLRMSPGKQTDLERVPIVCSSQSNTGTENTSTAVDNHTSQSDRKDYRPSNRTSTAFAEDEDESWKVCGVCNDKATGYHFNALTCEGCKGFFRRSIKNGKTFACSYNNQCNITKNNRRQCQACRLHKCIQIGMKRECIMSSDQIQSKKILVLTNRMKRTAQEWIPTEMSSDQKMLLDDICTAFKQSNAIPDKDHLRGKDVVERDADNHLSPCFSPNSNSNSNFLDLIKCLSSEIASRAPSNMTTSAHVLHFTDIMEFSIREVIKFCKRIPTFLDLDLSDQIALLKSGCTEILFLKANYTYDIEKKALSLGPDLLYTKESFVQGGMSCEYADYYLKFHEDLGILHLDNKEMSALSAIALFSADRSDIVAQSRIESQQELIACALQSYTENVIRARNRFANIMAFLPRLRTLNVLCAHAFNEVQKEFGDGIHPLVLEIQPEEKS